MKLDAWMKGSVLLVVVFASGIAVGTTYGRLRSRSQEVASAEAHDALHHLARDLELDPEQQRAIAAILNRRQSDVDAAWQAMQPHVRATLNSASDEIVAVLRPEQAVKYRKMVEMAHPAHHR